MQYLVTMKFLDPGPLMGPQQALGMMRGMTLPGLEVLVNLKSEGKIVAGGVPVGERALAVIVEAESTRELDSLLIDIPLWGTMETKVTPLQDIEERLEFDRRFTERLEATLQQ